MSKKIIIGLSGGVDSSVALLLLKQKSYDVTAVFMKNWEEDDIDSNSCNAEADIKDAEDVCKTLDVPLKKINFSSEYWDNVFVQFLEEYQLGRTPNPDILCNKEIKFKAFVNYAKQLGGDYIATGHYVRKRILDSGKFQLLKGLDSNKDQSYFLYMLNQRQLKNSFFPLGTLNKSTVRSIAKKYKLKTYNKKDSTGICFIGKRKFKKFLTRYLPALPGEIHDEKGTVLGKHDGVIYYTIGQRKGLGIGGIQNKYEQPWFVAKKDIQNNRLIVVQGTKHYMLLRNQLQAKNLHWILNRAPAHKFYCKAKIRYRQCDQDCEVILNKTNEKNARVNFKLPQRGITEGQSVVFYDNEVCLGGGIISS